MVLALQFIKRRWEKRDLQIYPENELQNNAPMNINTKDLVQSELSWMFSAALVSSISNISSLFCFL